MKAQLLDPPEESNPFGDTSLPPSTEQVFNKHHFVEETSAKSSSFLTQEKNTKRDIQANPKNRK